LDCATNLSPKRSQCGQCDSEALWRLYLPGPADFPRHFATDLAQGQVEFEAHSLEEIAAMIEDAARQARITGSH
jgi:hypothetical protein